MRRTVGALIRKDLLLERRSPESLPAMLLFSLGTFVIFHFALNQEEVSGDLAWGILWVTLLFAAVLGINRLFGSEREEGGLDGFLLAPVTARRCSWPRRPCCSPSWRCSRSS